MSGVNIKVIVCVAAVLCCSVSCMDYLLGWQEVRSGRDAVLFGKHSDRDTPAVKLRTDFASFYYAVKGCATGVNIYNARALDSLATLDGVENHVLPYLYPPFFAIAAQPLATLSPAVAQRVWTIVSIFAFCLIVVLTLLTPSDVDSPDKRYWIACGVAAVVLFLILPFRNNLFFGQINFLVLACISASLFFFHERKDWAAGAFLAFAVLIKVTPALLLLPLVLQKRLRVLYGFALCIAGAISVTILATGTEPWEDFFELLPAIGYARNVAGGFHPSIVANFSLAGLLMRTFTGQAHLVRITTMIVGVLLFAFLLYRTLRRRGNQDLLALLLPYLVLMIVVSPVTWLHHLIFMFPGAVFTLRHIWLNTNGKIRAPWIFLTLVMFALASIDFQPLYGMMNIPEDIRPWVTSMNLYVLLGIFFGSIVLEGGRQPLRLSRPSSSEDICRTNPGTPKSVEL